jgi:hypothetical protein
MHWRGDAGASPSPALRERVAGAQRRPGEGARRSACNAPSPQPSPLVGERGLFGVC